MMPFTDSPFGGQLPTNLPQPIGLPAANPVHAAPQQMPPMMEPMRMPAMDQAPVRSEFESIISGIGGLMKQSRDAEEKKKAAETAKDLLAQLTALKEERNQAPEATTAKPPPGGEPADMDDYMKRNARFESGGNENAVNQGSGATGLFQFLPSTWNWIAKAAPDLGLTPEGMKDRTQQIKAMRYYTDKSVKTLEPILGRKPTGGELYLLHLLGHSGGPAVLSKLDAPLTETISEGARRGNPFLKQYETGRELIAGLNQRFGGSNAR